MPPGLCQSRPSCSIASAVSLSIMRGRSVLPTLLAFGWLVPNEKSLSMPLTPFGWPLPSKVTR
jgi:hypothetical protein